MSSFARPAPYVWQDFTKRAFINASESSFNNAQFTGTTIFEDDVEFDGPCTFTDDCVFTDYTQFASGVGGAGLAAPLELPNGAVGPLGGPVLLNTGITGLLGNPVIVATGLAGPSNTAVSAPAGLTIPFSTNQIHIDGTGGGNFIATLNIEPPQTANRTITIKRTAADAELVDTENDYVMGGTKRFKSARFQMGDGTTIADIKLDTIAAAREYALPDPGISATKFVVKDGASTLNDTRTFAVAPNAPAVNLTNTSDQIVCGGSNKGTLNIPQGASSAWKASFPDPSASTTDAKVAYTNGPSQTFSQSNTFSSAPTVPSLIVTSASNSATIKAASQAAARDYTFPDAGANANVALSEGAATWNGSKTFGSAPTVPSLIVTSASNSATLKAASQAAARDYTFPDAGANANVALSEGAATWNGLKSFGTGITLPTSGGTAATLDAYEEPNSGTLTATSAIYTLSGSDLTIGYRVIRTGKNITLEVNGLEKKVDAGGGADVITLSTLPDRFKPTTNNNNRDSAGNLTNEPISFVIEVIDFSLTMRGQVTLSSGGVLVISRDFLNTLDIRTRGNFTNTDNSKTSGWKPFSISYPVNS